MYVCEELLCFFLCSVSFLFHSLCSVVRYARDCLCTCYVLAGRLQKSPERLAMNHGDGYREVQEERYSVYYLHRMISTLLYSPSTLHVG